MTNEFLANPFSGLKTGKSEETRAALEECVRRGRDVQMLATLPAWKAVMEFLDVEKQSMMRHMIEDTAFRTDGAALAEMQAGVKACDKLARIIDIIVDVGRRAETELRKGEKRGTASGGSTSGPGTASSKPSSIGSAGL
jgi:hypothetical protein